jgi:ribosomal protein S27AE
MVLQPVIDDESRRDYRRRNLIFWGLFLSFIPATLLIDATLGRLINPTWAAELITTAWFAGVIATGIWRLNFECPRCGKKFYTKHWFRQPFTTKCVHCHFRPADK